MTEFLARLVHRAAWRIREMGHTLSLVEKEFESTAAVPWHARPALWWRGFLGEAAVLYQFANNDRRLYLSDYARSVKTRAINGEYGVILDDKLLFTWLLRDHSRYLPIVFGTLSEGRIAAAPGVNLPAAGTSLPALLRCRRDLVLKPVIGGGGRGVTFLHVKENGLKVNGRGIDEPELDRIAVDCEGYLVSEYVRQHPALASLYPAATNTIRIVTMRDDDGAFIAAAALRIGCERSKPLDNWSLGGLSASIDRQSGRLGQAASYPVGRSRLEWHACHPDSGAKIEGTVIPNWKEVSAAILDMASSLPFLPYVGWDIAVTGDGFRILEGNRYSDVHILQIHGPLLADERVAAFYRRYDVIGRRRRKR